MIQRLPHDPLAKFVAARRELLVGYRACVIGSDSHTFSATALIAKTTRRRSRRSTRFCWSGPSKSGAEPDSLSGSVLNAKRILPGRPHDRRAMRPQNFAVVGEAEHHACQQAFVAHIIKLNPVRRRFDFFQPERVWSETVEPRSPIGCQGRPTRVHRGAIASALQAGFRRVEIPQRVKIAPPACVQPIYNNGNLVKIVWQ